MQQARAEFVEGMGSVTEFWGAGRYTGRLWAVLYLSPEAMTMEQLCQELGITKGHASTNLRALLRLRMVHRSRRPGDRRDWYTAEADIWAVARGVLRERGEQEFDRALRSTDRALEALSGEQGAQAAFMRRRLGAVREFNAALDRAVGAALRLSDLRAALAWLTQAPGA